MFDSLTQLLALQDAVTAIYAHWYNTYTDVMGGTKHFPIRFKALLHKMEPMPGAINWAKNLWLGRSEALKKNLVFLFCSLDKLLALSAKNLALYP